VDRKSFTKEAKRVQEIDRIVRKLDPAVRGQAFSHLSGKAASALPIEVLVTLVLQLAAEDAQRDLRELTEDVEKLNAQKARLRDLVERLAQDSDELAGLLRSEYEDLFDTGDLGELQSLRLQIALDRRSKLLQTLSNILKKLSDTDSAIIQNLK
jgi:hypothetical protein